jgi:hypothetical protein
VTGLVARGLYMHTPVRLGLRAGGRVPGALLVPEDVPDL